MKRYNYWGGQIFGSDIRSQTDLEPTHRKDKRKGGGSTDSGQTHLRKDIRTETKHDILDINSRGETLDNIRNSGLVAKDETGDSY